MSGIVRCSMNQCRRLFALSVAFACSVPAIATAEVHVEGTPAAVRITTNQDTIANVLSALSATFNIPLRTGVLIGAAADATYSGSLRQVVSRLLDGYNYVIKADDSKTTEIIVLGRRGEVTIPPRSDVAAPPPSEVTVPPKAPPEVASV